MRRPTLPLAPQSFVLLVVLLLAGAPASEVAAQARAASSSNASLVERFWVQRFRAEAFRLIEQHGAHTEPLAVEALPVPSDTVRPWLASFLPVPDTTGPLMPPPFVVDRVQAVPKLARDWFEATFGETLWAYLGAHSVTPLDTLRTSELRARLEDRFGAPTATLVETADGRNLSREHTVQFEYRFVVNDSIPVVVMDVNGPFERGIVFASDHRYRDRLFDLRTAFLEKALLGAGEAPYVDYYYNPDTGVWYRTGFDGRSYFIDRIARPNLERGRPWINPDGR